MARLFWLSDTHFSHKNIIDYCSRPFNSIEDMDLEMKVRWIRTVTNPDDWVVHVGDFGMVTPAAEHFKQLPGHKVLVRGNHDSKGIIKLPWDAVVDELRLPYAFVTHVPPEGYKDWPGKAEGALLIHGHTHGQHVSPPGVYDVSVESSFIDYTPRQLKFRGRLIGPEELRDALGL